ncbi:MAG: TlpA family protein disulfide reductase [Alphaproteobacteria bacterium]|nr:TlpA family protein disulfide reductase [Alphaproteobacteria bacterium]
MTFFGAFTSLSTVRRALVAAVVAGVATGAALALGAADGPPTLRGGYGGYEPASNPLPAPSVAFLDPDGNAIKLDAFIGRVVVLNFWATWCAPCIKELPALERLHTSLDPGQAQVVLVTIDRKGTEVAQPFLVDLGVKNLTTHADPQAELARSLGALGLPTTVIIDRQGRVRGQLQGDAEWDSDAAKALVRHYVEED